MATITHEGAAYPVNDAWHAAYSEPWPDLPGLEKADLDALRKELLRISNDRHLTADEIARLDALDKHFNVRQAVAFLQGRPHTDFGFTGVNQVHGNRVTPSSGIDPGCGCELHVVFDHSEAMAVSAAKAATDPLPSLQDIIDEENAEAARMGVSIAPDVVAADAAYRLSWMTAQRDKAIAAWPAISALHGYDGQAAEDVAGIERKHYPHYPRWLCDPHSPLYYTDFETVWTTVIAANEAPAAPEA